MKRILHPHQQTAMDMLRQSLSNGHRRVMMQAPTGFGKTVCFGAIVHGALAKGKRVLCTVPRIQLVEQTVESLWIEDVRDIGVIQADHSLTNSAMPVQIASIQTLSRRGIPPADVVVVDEAHVVFDLFKRWMADPGWAKVPFIGLSATPWTKGLGKLYEDLIIAATTQELIEKGFLSPFKVFAPPSGFSPDLSKVKTVAGDYHEGQLSEAMSTAGLIADAVATWQQLGENRPTFCFGVDCAHAQKLQNAFLGAGIPTEYIDANTPMTERQAIRDRFHAGATKVVSSVGCLTMGIDWRPLSCISFNRPTKSEMLFVQIIGRALRTSEGKSNAIILDHTNTTQRLGFVTDIHHEHLDDGRPKKAASKPREREPIECPKCHMLKPKAKRVCPNCGFVTRAISEIEPEAGELVEMGAGRKPKQLPLATMAEKQQWFSMLTAIRLERGYKPGWAANQYREKFGVWPRGLSEEPMPPDRAVLNFVRWRLIAYAKRRKPDDARIAP